MLNGVNDVDSNPSVPFSDSRERRIVWLLCLLAAAHVLVFSAAFPFFNNVDEGAHFDLVIKYSQGSIPLGLAPFSAESVRYLVICGSPEYLNDPVTLVGGRFPPPVWTEPPTENTRQWLLALGARYRAQTNHESMQPPLYYALAGLWWHLGRGLGFEAGQLLYWLRFLNALIIVALVWLGFITARVVFPGRRFVQLGVPALLAFLPQTAFYSIQNDVLLPLSFGAAFLCLVHFWRADRPGIKWGMATGLALAATYLTKISSLPLLMVFGWAVLAEVRRLFKQGTLRPALPALVVLLLSAGLPIGGWMMWTKHAGGDYLGTATKIQQLGWTYKPFDEWWHHPIFTPHGMWVFTSGLLASFWRGEFTWQLQRLALPAVDAVYVIASMLFLGVAAAALVQRFPVMCQLQRQALWFSLASFMAAMAFLGFLSVIYDFHDCFYPSRVNPFFTSGRLMLGVLIPFLLLFVYGLDRTFNCLKPAWPRWLTLAGFILFMLISEIAIDRPAFLSPYNWFHM